MHTNRLARETLFARRGLSANCLSMRLWFLLPILALTGCIHVTMDPIQVHAVVDVNVKVDQALTDFFGDLDSKSKTIKTP
ncbi:MAG: hypothetical protein RIQ79_1401 [Verrucomicrobiota bacterium]